LFPSIRFRAFVPGKQHRFVNIRLKENDGIGGIHYGFKESVLTFPVLDFAQFLFNISGVVCNQNSGVLICLSFLGLHALGVIGCYFGLDFW
jgi:hypothetical protein